MPDTITPERLAEIRERVEAAIEGPWMNIVTDGQCHIRTKHPDCYGFSVIPLKRPLNGSDPTELGTATFIAHAREDVPALLAEVERLRALLTEPELESVQPCGCVTCTCEEGEQCHGCGARRCGKPDCVFGPSGARIERDASRLVYKSSPSYAALRAEVAALKAEAETFELQVNQLSEQFQALLGDYEALRVQLGSATSSIDEAPDGTILFESEVPASFSKKYSECVRRVRVLANDRVSGGLMVFGMEGWHPEPDGSGGRDFTPEEIAQHRYGDMVGVWANQGERVCIRLLLDRVSALKAKLDDTEAAYAAVMEYDRILNESLSKALGVPDDSRLIDEWEELFDAKIKGAVPREVAERAMDAAVYVAKAHAREQGFTRPIVILEENWKYIIPSRRFSPGPDTTPWVEMMDEALARAEAEHTATQKLPNGSESVSIQDAEKEAKP